jgi:hypothetical protein
MPAGAYLVRRRCAVPAKLPFTIAVVFSASVALGACGRSTAQTTFASSVSPTASMLSTRISPQPISAVPVFGFACPVVQPFTSDFELLIQEARGINVNLTQLSFRFVDGSGISGSSLLMSASDLNGRFGTTLIPAGTSRTFAFHPQFGCGLTRPNAVLIDLLLLDAQGGLQPMSVTAPIVLR